MMNLATITFIIHKLSPFKNTQKVTQIFLDDFEINEIDEDMYTESNFEDRSIKNSKNQKRSKNKKRRITPIDETPHIDTIEVHNQQNHEIQQKIIEKYQKKKNKSIHKHQDDKIRISIKIDYPQQAFQSQLQNKTKNNQLTQEKFNEKSRDDYSNTLTSFTHSLNRNRSNSKERSIKNNDSFEDYESHIVLRNTSSNIFRYSNYNKNFEDNQISSYQANSKSRKEDPLVNMPKIYYDNAQIENKFMKQKQSIDSKMLNQDQIILDKYAHRFNLNQDECNFYYLGNSISDKKSYRFKSIDKYKRQLEDN